MWCITYLNDILEHLDSMIWHHCSEINVTTCHSHMSDVHQLLNDTTLAQYIWESSHLDPFMWSSVHWTIGDPVQQKVHLVYFWRKKMRVLHYLTEDITSFPTTFTKGVFPFTLYFVRISFIAAAGWKGFEHMPTFGPR